MEKQLAMAGDAINTIRLLEQQLEERENALFSMREEIATLQQMVKNEQNENLQLNSKLGDLRAQCTLH